jgi:hypothetical protein
MAVLAIDPAEFGITDARADVEESLHRIVLLDQQIKALSEEREVLRDAARLELTNDGTPIIDMERGIVATLREKRKPASIDLVSMAKRPDQEVHIVEAARSGVLNVSLTALRALKGKAEWADALLKMEMPSGVTVELRIASTRSN